MEQLPTPDPGRRTLGGLSPAMTTFVVVDAVLLLAFGVFLALFLTGSLGGSGDAGDAPSTPAQVGADGSATPTPPDAVAEPAAEASFALPSGNIACEIAADAATCTIANSIATPPADPSCTGDIGHTLTVTAEGAETPCVEGDLPGVAAADVHVLDYGQSTTVGDFTCTSSSTGVTCKHDPTGKGFQLARAGSSLF